ncbi:FecR domain-containing protein [Gimesia aquarii]|uniref:FecR protein n=1 Tax=Gimesia aquarii TaxID=2527964 RepID=A0A517WZZ7_9PLAN|nr:FecR domain-containing protein [Gimesia aquarii]QDU10818.1 FecR protein [Gimesia aquarii]
MSNPQEDFELDFLFQAMLDQTLSSEQAKRLEEILLVDERARSDYIALIEIDSLLQRVHHQDETVEVSLPATSNPKRQATGYWVVIAICVFAMVGIVTLMTPEKAPVPLADVPPVVPDIPIATVDAVGYGASRIDLPFQVGETLVNNEVIDLDSGTMRLKFLNGVMVALRGPAILELVEPNRCILSAGQLVAKVPEEAIGFTVETPAGRVVDLGTEFGVEIGNEGATQTHVIKGRVSAAVVKQNWESEPQVVEQNSAVAFDMSNTSIRKTPFAPDKFADALSMFKGIKSLSPTTAYLHNPPPSVDRGALTDTQRVFLIPEGREVPVDEELRKVITDLSEQSLLDLESLSNPDSVEEKIDSFLVHGDSGPKKERTVSGFIEFEEPIIAVIVEDDGLKATDNLLGIPDMKYTNPNATKYRKTELESDDEIIISGDRRRLEYKLKLRLARDQFRVLIQSK